MTRKTTFDEVKVEFPEGSPKFPYPGGKNEKFKKGKKSKNPQSVISNLLSYC